MLLRKQHWVGSVRGSIQWARSASTVSRLPLLFPSGLFSVRGGRGVAAVRPCERGEP
jgi:hypothetical protein